MQCSHPSGIASGRTRAVGIRQQCAQISPEQALTAAAIFAGLCAKSSTTCTLCSRLRHREAPGHTLEMSYGIGKSEPLAAEVLADAKCRGAGFQGCGFREAANDTQCPCEKASPRPAGALHGQAATRQSCSGQSAPLPGGTQGSDRPHLTRSMKPLKQASQKGLLSRQRSYGPWKY